MEGHGRVKTGIGGGLDIVPMGRSIWREFLGRSKPMGRRVAHGRKNPMGRVLRMGRIVGIMGVGWKIWSTMMA